jgi:hypothetical protein
MSGESGLRGASLWAVVGAAALFALSAGTFAVRIPFDQAPDEWTHDYYNVRFLLAEGRLPVTGQDDRSAFETAHAKPTGRVVARYSYTNAPALNYVLYAGAGWLGPRALGLDRITSERLLSVFWGLVFFLGVYGAGRAVGAPSSTALAGGVAAAFVPQVQFVSAYINQDAWALSASAAALWAVVHDARVRSPRSLALVGAATGWVLTARLNYWIYLPGLVLWVVWRLVRAPAAPGARARLAGAWVAGAIAVCGFWLGRVLVVTGSLTGQGRVLQEMRRVQGVTVEPRLGLGTLRALDDGDVVGKTFRSAIMMFDYMGLTFSRPGVYSTIAVLVAVMAVGAVATIVIRRDRLAARVAAGLGALALASLALHLYNSVFWDFQPQGRYLFPLFAPAAVFFAWLAGRHVELRPGLWVFAAAMLVLTGRAQQLVSRVYGGLDPRATSGVRRLPLEAGRRPVLETWVTVPRGGWRGVEVEHVGALVYDVAFYGLEVIDEEAGASLRTAYVNPWDWRSLRRPEFRFRAVEDSAGRRYRVRLFAEQPGLRGADLRTDCPAATSSPPGGETGAPGLCVRLLY